MKWGRRIFWILVIFFLFLVISQFTEIQKLVQTLKQGRWQWVLITALLQIGYYLIYTAVYRASFYAVGVNSRFRKLIPLVFAMMFVNVAAPAGGAGGAALFIDDARRRGESPSRTAAGTLLAMIADFGAFVLILIVGMVYLFRLHDLKSYEILTAILLLLLVGGLSAVLFMGVYSPGRLRRLLDWVQKRIVWFGIRLHKPELVAENWAEKNASEYIEASLAMVTHPGRLGITLGVAFAGHLINLLSLYSVFVAFNQVVSPGMLVAGYAMGILFWIISITPQGIGVVEGMMTLVFTSLGVSPEKSAIVALAFRGLTFWIPFFIGFVLLRRLRMFNPKARPVSGNFGVRLAAVLTMLMGILNVLSAVSAPMPSRIRQLMDFSPLEVIHGGRFTAAISGFALLILANQLRRRKRVAWWMAIIVLLVSTLSHLFKGLDYEEAILALALAGWLIYLRPYFHARSDVPSIRQGFYTLLGAALFTLLYGVIGFYLLDHQFKVNFNLSAAINQTFLMFTSFYNPGLEPITGLGRYFAASIYAIAFLTFLYAGIMLIRPVLNHEPSSYEERIRAREIVEKFGHTALAPFALLLDKYYFFSPGGSLIQYVTEDRIALTLGDPIGPKVDLAKCLYDFIAFCKLKDWLPAFYQVVPDSLSVYQKAGFQHLCVGNEGIVRLSEFSLEGKANKDMRYAFHKLEKLGYKAQYVPPPLSAALMTELHEISDAWLTLVSGTEKRFSLGWFDQDYIANGPVMVVKDQSGTIMAFTNILSEFQLNEICIDLMRHRPEAEPGMMDFLFVSLFQWARQAGVETFNLGLSSLSGVGETEQDPVIERGLHYVYEHINQFYNFKGLHAFKEKFHPEWQPRYLIYPDLYNLPLVVLAMVKADSGKNFLGSYLRKK